MESELLVKHSSVFHSPGEDISLVTNQNEENPQKKVTSQKPNASLEDKEKPAQSPIESVSIRNNSCDPQEQSQSKESETIDTSYEDSIEKNKAIQSNRRNSRKCYLVQHSINEKISMDYPRNSRHISEFAPLIAVHTKVAHYCPRAPTFKFELVRR